MKNIEPTGTLIAHPPTDNVSGAEFPEINKTRYSDEELKEFRQIVQYKLAEAHNDYELLRSTLLGQDENGTEDTSPTFKPAEEASEGFSREEISSLAIRQKKFIDSLQNALVRIENKTYGICRISGKLISKERLRSVPHTTLCIDAKLDLTGTR